MRLKTWITTFVLSTAIAAMLAAPAIAGTTTETPPYEAAGTAYDGRCGGYSVTTCVESATATRATGTLQAASQVAVGPGGYGAANSVAHVSEDLRAGKTRKVTVTVVFNVTEHSTNSDPVAAPGDRTEIRLHAAAIASGNSGRWVGAETAVVNPGAGRHSLTFELVLDEPIASVVGVRGQLGSLALTDAGALVPRKLSASARAVVESMTVTEA